MNPDDLKKRTKQFALRMLQLAESLPRTPSGRVLATQIAKCGTSVASNYRAACKGRSKAEFIAKLGIVEEEAAENQFWIEMATEAKLIPGVRLNSLREEAQELTAIFAASRKTASRTP